MTKERKKVFRHMHKFLSSLFSFFLSLSLLSLHPLLFSAPQLRLPPIFDPSGRSNHFLSFPSFSFFFLHFKLIVKQQPSSLSALLRCLYFTTLLFSLLALSSHRQDPFLYCFPLLQTLPLPHQYPQKISNTPSQTTLT